MQNYCVVVVVKVNSKVKYTFTLLFQLSELEQRVIEAETRAEDAEEKVSTPLPIFYVAKRSIDNKILTSSVCLTSPMEPTCLGSQHSA